MSYYDFMPLEPFELARAGDVNDRFEQIATAFGSLPSLSEFQTVVRGTAEAAGTANGLTLDTIGANITSLALGQRLSFKAAQTNTNAATMNVDGLGAVSIRRRDGAALVAGDLVAGRIYDLIYDGSYWQLASLTTVELAAYVSAAYGYAGSSAASADAAASSQGAAATSAGEAAGHVTSALNAAALAQAWATYTGGAVAGGEFSAKHYALLAAGYAASINPANLVALAGSQTIAGAKTFSAAIVANGGVTINGQTITALSAAGKAMVEAANAAAQVALLPAFGASAKGLVPSPGGTSNTTDFLRRDGTWAAPGGIPSLLDVNDEVLAGTTAQAAGTEVAIGATVAGSTLVRSNSTNNDCALSGQQTNFSAVSVGSGNAASVGATGTWRAIGRTYRYANSSDYPVNLWRRIA